MLDNLFQLHRERVEVRREKGGRGACLSLAANEPLN
jgi:hypothetical protein